MFTAKKKFTSNSEINERGVSEPPKLTNNLSNYSDSISTSTTSVNSLCLSGNNEMMEMTFKQGEQLDEKDLVHMKFKDLALTYTPSMSNNVLGREIHRDEQVALGKGNSGNFSNHLDYPAIIEKVFSILPFMNCGTFSSIYCFAWPFPIIHVISALLAVFFVQSLD